jgi:hypothetical protein
MAEDTRAVEVLKQLLAALTAVEGCRFCCVAADEDCHKAQFDSAIKRAKRFLQERRQEALNKPS